MIKALVSRWQNILYVQIWAHQIQVTNVRTGAVYVDEPLVALKTLAKGRQTVYAVGAKAHQLVGQTSLTVVNPFDHPRQLLAEFEVAVSLLRYLFKLAMASNRLGLPPAVVIQPMERVEGGLTGIERRAWHELAMASGARDVVVHCGPPLDREQIDLRRLRTKG